jgi:hypothetical protein
MLASIVREQVDEFADFVTRFGWMSKSPPLFDGVSITAPDSLLTDVASLFKVGNHGLCCPLSYLSSLRQVADADVWLLGDEEQDPSMVGQ